MEPARDGVENGEGSVELMSELLQTKLQMAELNEAYTANKRALARSLERERQLRDEVEDLQIRLHKLQAAQPEKLLVAAPVGATLARLFSFPDRKASSRAVFPSRTPSACLTLDIESGLGSGSAGTPKTGRATPKHCRHVDELDPLGRRESAASSSDGSCSSHVDPATPELSAHLGALPEDAAPPHCWASHSDASLHSASAAPSAPMAEEVH